MPNGAAVSAEPTPGGVTPSDDATGASATGTSATPGTGTEPPQAPEQPSVVVTPSSEPTGLIVETESEVTLSPQAPNVQAEDCTAEFAKTELQPVYLAFAFDVSGSMGKLDEPHHDPELKWEPVVQATKAFFADDASTGFRASLTFFPAAEDRCDAESYAVPSVTMTALPSSEFALAIDEVTPENEDDWRGGTPTLAVLQGTYQTLENVMADDPQAAHYAVVLVTDGNPQGCDDEEDDIEVVAAAVASAAARIPTYVIGVSNPPGGPDTTSNLNELAEAGGTGAAFMIETGEPEQTAQTLGAAIAKVRASVPSCEAVLPELPGGQAFDPERVNVTLGREGELTELGYDEACEADLAWHFDDPAAPSRIILCEAVCKQAQSEPALDVSVAFGCQRLAAVR
jgi:von Willebrand factor type A domain